MKRPERSPPPSIAGNDSATLIRENSKDSYRASAYVGAGLLAGLQWGWLNADSSGRIDEHSSDGPLTTFLTR
jgi:hypothetical protein